MNGNRLRTLARLAFGAKRNARRAALTLALAAASVSLGAADAAAAPAARTARAKVAARAPARSPTPRARAAVAPSAAASTTTAAAPALVPAPAAPGATPPKGAAEAPVRSTSGGPASQAVVKTEEARAGERTYTFGAQEVEGRLKSPQILYFLRRVRAEFDPAPLGHRSFLLELYDTRRHPAFE